MKLGSFRPGKKKSRPVGGAFRGAASPVVLDPRRRRLGALALAAAFVVLVAVLIPRVTPTDHRIDYDIDSEPVASEDFVAEFQFAAIDLRATREARDQAAAIVPDTYRVETALVEDRIRAFEEQVSRLRATGPDLRKAIETALLASTSRQNEQDLVEGTVRSFVDALMQSDPNIASVQDPNALVVWLMPNLDSLPEREFAPLPEGSEASTDRPAVSLKQPAPPADAAERPAGLQFANLDQLAALSHSALNSLLNYGLLQDSADRTTTAADPERRIQIYRERTPGEQPTFEKVAVKDIPRLSAAQQLLQERITTWIETRRGESVEQITLDLPTIQSASYALVKPYFADTLKFDREYTTAAKEAARDEVEPVMKRIEPNEKLQDAHVRWTEQSREDVRTFLALKEREGKEISLITSIVSVMIFAALVLGCLTWATPLYERKDAFLGLTLTLLVMCACLIVGRIALYFEDSGYIVPIAAGPILIAILLNVRIAGVVAFLTAVLLSLQYNFSWSLFVVSVAMSLTGVFSISVVRRRSDIGRAVFRATFVGLLVTVAVALSTDSLFSESAAQHLILIALNGFICLFLVPGLLPPLEQLSGITTDIQLLEYSDLNNEVLGRLAIEVPATYSHSLMLGQLAEAAADAIGANGLQARVCAYYHDIGKLHRPEYFSENQTGQNIHEGLNPRLSARAIAAHVTRGAEMAREFHLPKPIVDGILEHHGTNLISFFYDQALQQSKHGDVEQADFRYPGPKPQSPETAILMICDGVESGVRSIKNPNEERIREFVDKIITSRAEDGQFDECDLTLKDLDTIGEVITMRMVSTLHRRIAYPGQSEERQKQNVISLSGGSEK